MATTTNSPGQDIAGYEAFSGNKNKGSFLWWCAGVHMPTLAAYPTEHTKYNTLGGVLLATFALAALSSGYAFYTIFGVVSWSILFALLWATIIFNFDRFMVATIRKYGMSTARQWQVALPRIVLAIMIGITIARPLELKLFEKEISVKVAANLNTTVANYNRQQQLIYQSKTGELLAERNQLLLRRKSMEDTLLKLQLAYVQEADGTGGSGRRGVEHITLLKQQAYTQTAAQFGLLLPLVDSQLAAKNRQLTAEELSLQKNIAEFAATAARNVGFLEKNKALHNLSGEEESVYLANLLLSLLIILLETAPILAKLLLPVGPYDLSLARQELVPMTAIERALATEQESARTGNMAAV
jgi:Domain of unknown function (DUF4407)